MLGELMVIITNWVVGAISSFGYVGVGALMAIESAAIPLPSEIIMPFAGFAVSAGKMTLLGIAIAGAIGSTVGAWLTYWIGRYGGRPLIEKYGKYLLLSRHDMEMADCFFSRHGVWSIFIGRILPIVRTYISIPAGIMRVPFWIFTTTSLLGSFIWSLFLGYLGFVLGGRWNLLEQYFRKFDILIAVVIVAAIIFWIMRHLRKNKKAIE